MGLVVVERFFELALNRRNVARLLARGGRVVARDGYGALILVHAVFIPAMLAEAALAPWAGAHALTFALLGLFLAADALRYASMIALGERWTTKVIVLPEVPVVRGGPYRFLKHPIYVAVVALLLALPLAFGLYATAAVVGGGNVAAVLRRIRLEEAGMARAGMIARPPRA